MIQKTFVIQNPAGLHFGPAGVLCREACNFKCKIEFTVRNSSVNAKSVLSVLGAAVRYGEEVCFTFDGIDEEEAAERFTELQKEGFGE